MVDDVVVPIEDDAGLLRRIRPDQIVHDQNLGRKRPSSAAFKNPCLSVDCEPILTKSGLDWNFSLKGYPEHSLVRITARVPRSQNLTVEHKPITENPAHSEILGKKTQGIANNLVAASEWVFEQT